MAVDGEGLLNVPIFTGTECPQKCPQIGLRPGGVPLAFSITFLTHPLYKL
jgi:hypothetical protein